MAACGEADEGRTSDRLAEVPPPPAPLVIDGDAEGVVFRYRDPETGELATGASLEDVPAPARSQVIVYDADAVPIAGWEHVADLRGGYPIVTAPTRGFELAGGAAVARAGDRGEDAPPAARRRGRRLVTMFSTRGCGYCARARAFLDEHQIPFTEYDVETNPKAEAELAKLADKADRRREELQGVPIIFVGDGRRYEALVGFNAERLERALGI